MTNQALPGDYRIQIVRRTSETPPEIKGEWAVHCTLCKWVRWVDAHDSAFEVAHYEHPSSDVHQKWIGRVLVGREPSPFRGYHAGQSESALSRGRPNAVEEDFRYPKWTPAAVPAWIERLRYQQRCQRYEAQDEVGQRRRAARPQAAPLTVRLAYSREGCIPISHAIARPASIYELQVDGLRIGEVAITGAGEWVFNGRLFRSKAEASADIIAHARRRTSA